MVLQISMESLPPPLPRNPRTARLHRRDLIRQIYLPFGAAVLAALVLAGLAIYAPLAGQAAADSVWADISLMFLILIGAGLALAPLALFAGLAAGLWYALRYLPGYARVAQEYLAQAAAYTRRAADRAAEPFITAHSALAAARGGWKQAVRRKQRT